MTDLFAGYFFVCCHELLTTLFDMFTCWKDQHQIKCCSFWTSIHHRNL